MHEYLPSTLLPPRAIAAFTSVGANYSRAAHALLVIRPLPGRYEILPFKSSSLDNLVTNFPDGARNAYCDLRRESFDSLCASSLTNE